MGTSADLGDTSGSESVSSALVDVTSVDVDFIGSAAVGTEKINLTFVDTVPDDFNSPTVDTIPGDFGCLPVSSSFTTSVASA